MNKIQEANFLNKIKGFFSRFHLKLLAMMRAKASSFLEQQKGNVEDHYLSCVFAPFWRRKEDEDDSPKVVVVAASQGEGESSYVLKEMEVGVFKFCLQRPNGVVFEGLLWRFGYGVGREGRKKKKKKNRASWRREVLEREYEFEKWDECMSVGVWLWPCLVLKGESF